MRRRDAMRAVTALAVGSVAGGCDTPSPSAPPTVHTGTAAPSAVPFSGRPAVLPDEIRHGPRDRRNVALTFHGQGDPAIVGRLLDELAQDRTRVTVLAVGTWLATQPELGRRILA